MDLTTFFQSNLFTWLILPILIFMARIVDVSIGTVRVISIARGMRGLAPLLGFFEVLVWILVIGQIMRNLTNPLCYLAYASGFATGNFVGMVIESKLALGSVLIRVITRMDATDLIQLLRLENYHVTVVDAEGRDGKVKILFMLVSRQDIPHVVEIIQLQNPNAFYSIEDVRFVQEQEVALRKPRERKIYPGLLRRLGK
jgi:uncharacterized protein YebE (UPF0316 family)